jgi:hypothetical protein
MSLAILTTADRFGLAAPCKAWEAFETGCLLAPLASVKVFDAEKRELLPNYITQVLILGGKALSITHPDKELDQFRGCLTTYQDKLAIASYHPIDAADQTSWESEDAESTSNDEKDFARTQPSNYFFWIRRDTHKLLSKEYLSLKHPPLKYYAAPNLEKFLAYAYKAIANPFTTIYLDIECRREDHSLTCVGLAFDDSPVFVLPIYFHNNIRSYGDAWKILLFLSKALSTRTIVVHNAMFDLFILSRYYRVLVGRKVFDTMLCQHRCFPEAEKSLGHTISYWTYLGFHKDMAVENPRNPDQQAKLWEYNARDVYAMREVHKQQVKYLSNNRPLAASVDQANALVYPYLLCQLRGMAVDENALMLAKLEHAKRERVLKLIAQILSGEGSFNPGSAKQCIDFFHGKLHYEVVSRTAGGQPQMNQRALYRLRLKNNNPLLDVIIAYRIVAKEGSMLEFQPYEMPSYETI